MSAISDSIEAFIKQMLDDSDNIELKRNELAQFFGCAPSQINYVLTTRFTVDKGYLITSKRGGGGYISVLKVSNDNEDLYDFITQRIDHKISTQKAKDLIENLYLNDHISRREAILMDSAMSQLSVISGELRDYMRAQMLKAMISALIQFKNEEKNN